MCPDESGGGGCNSSFSSYPVRYFNGEVRLAVPDLQSNGLGVSWGHTRSYSNQVTAPGEGVNGNSWFIKEAPYLVEDASGNITFVSLISDVLWFDKSGNDYVARYFIRWSLAQDTGNNEFVLRDDRGQVLKFHNFHSSVPALKRGSFKSFIDAAGHATVASYGANDLISSFVLTDGGSNSCGYSYSYYSSGVNANRLQYVTLSINGADVRRASFDYYDGTDSNGSAGDLKRAQTQEWTGSTWKTLATHYYRYYKAGDTDGVVNGLKYVLTPLGYAAMVAAGITPETATNAQIQQSARHYFKYNADRSVKNEAVNAGTLDFAFTVTTSSHADGVNNWKKKTVETLPDGNRQIAYTNYTGQVILKVLVRMSGGAETGDKWYEYYQYDSAGRVTLRANSSAVDSVNEASAGLVTLKASAGFIRLYEYYGASPPSGGATGYMQHEKVKQGGSGSAIKLREWLYTARTVGSHTIYVPWKIIDYQSDSGGGSNSATTEYTYTWQGSTFQMDERTTTLPAVPDTQNGSGTANTRKEKFNAYNRLIWFQDERGYINGYTFDLSSGGLTSIVQDASSGTPWTPLGGSHLNLTTNYTVDTYGRITQALGPAHSIDIGGTSTSIRRAEWIVYKDDLYETWVGQGYQKTSDSSFTLINPVGITRKDETGRITDELQATRASASGKLLPTDSFPQSSWVRWRKNLYGGSPSLAGERVYFLIPASGAGTPGTNYHESEYGYDIMRRRIRAKGPEGTITRNVLNTPGWIKETWVGTNDNGATSADPSGGGATGNNMVKVAAFEYDANAAAGDGNLTRETRWVSASTSRVTDHTYDWRNRRITTDGEIDFYQESTFDNLNRLTRIDQKNTNAAGALVARSGTLYDNLGRVYQQLQYSVSGGTAGNSLKEKFWYDGAGNIIKRVPTGARVFEKMQYDGAGRLAKRFDCFDAAEADTNYAAAGTVTSDTVMFQEENTYDDASNVIQTTARHRFHDATGTGELTSPSGSQPKARVYYQAIYPDAPGRVQAQANYGTNAAASFTRPATVPARSDTVLVTSVEYNSLGDAWKVIDPMGTENRMEFDAAGRQTKLIENYVASGTGPDQNRTTDMTYTADNQVKTLIARNSITGDQTTTWVYGTTLSDSDAARNDLLRAKEFPDKSGASDRVEYKCNRQGQVKEIKDQIGTVRALDYDLLGRLQHDRVTTLGSGVNGAVRRLTLAFEARGLLQKPSSYDNATAGSGSIVNEVKYEYNGFALLTREYQSHSGAVVDATTPSVQYAYTDGSSNHARRTTMTNPDGTVIAYNYGTVGLADDALNRVMQIAGASPVYADYNFLGVAQTVIAKYSTEPGVELTYYTSGGSGDAGDQYTGLDRFGRVIDQRWRKVSDNTDRERVKYGFDRAGNRRWRQNTVAGTGQDEFYTYDGLYQIKTLDRGTLTGTPPTGISGTPSWEEDWNYDATGNWRGSSTAYLTKVSGSTTLNQNRTHNAANEITDITETTGTSWPTPAHDAAGNMTQAPQPLSLGNSFDLQYDAWNRLVEVKATGGSVVATYRYDGANRRVIKVTGGNTRHYYYSDQWQILEERLNALTTADKRFVWGMRYTDDLILRDSGGTRHYVLHDYFNVTAIVDTSGNVQERYGYDAFGAVRYMDASFGSRSASSYDWETLYAAYRFDGESGLYQVRHRYLHAKLGRWVNRDPWTLWSSTHYYLYVGDNSINHVDPTGLQSNAGQGAISLLSTNVLCITNMNFNPNWWVSPGGRVLPLWGTNTTSSDPHLIPLLGGNTPVPYPAMPPGAGCNIGDITTKVRSGKMWVDCPCTGRSEVDCYKFRECVGQVFAISSRICTIGVWQDMMECPCPEY